MATELGKAYVQIVPSAKGIGKAISNEIVPESTKAGKSAGMSIAGMIKGAIITAGIGKVLVSTIQQGGKLEQSLGGIETLFKDHASEVKSYASEAYKTTGLSANEYMENVTGFSASLLQSLGGDTKKAAEVAQTAMVDMADNSNKMGTAMESIQFAYQGFAKQNYTMLDNLKLGYGGTKKEMERLLTDAESLTGVKYDISNLSDVYEAIHVIQGELNITGTTAAEASTTIIGSWSAMASAFKNTLGSLALGEGLRPALEGLMETVSTFVFGNLIPMIGTIISGLPSMILIFWETALPQLSGIGYRLIEYIRNGISTGIPLFFEKLDEIIISFQTWVTTKLPVFLQSGVDWLSGVGQGFFTALPSLLTDMSTVVLKVTGTIAESIPMFLEKGKNLIATLAKGFMENLPAIEKAIKDILKKVIDLIVDKLPDILQKGIELIGKLAKGIIDNLPAIVSAIGRIVASIIRGIVQRFPDILSKGGLLIANLIKGMISLIPRVAIAIGKIILSILQAIGQKMLDFKSGGAKFIENLGKGMLDKLQSVVTIVGSIGKALVGKIKGMIGDFTKAGGDLIRGLWRGISDKTKWLIDKIGGFTDRVVSRFKSFFGIHSPSRVFAEIGKYLDEGLAKGIVDNTKPVENAMDKLGVAATGSFESDINYKLKSNAEDMNHRYAFSGKTLNDDSVKASTDMKKAIIEAIIEIFEMYKPVIELNDREIARLVASL